MQAKRGKKKPMVPSTTKRIAKHGMANQMAHAAEGRYQRQAMKDRMEKEHTARKKVAGQAMRNRTKEKGMSAGTMGGSRGGSKNGLIRALFGK